MSNVSDNFAAHSGSPDPIDELQLIRYLDGRLEGAQKQSVEDLLRTSAAVRRRLDALREEERLLRESLETLSEPSKRLSDKVIATLHTEERFRINAIRNKRLRRNLVWGLGVAASFVICVLLMKPRDSMGSAVAGTGGTVVLPSLERRPFGKNSSFYERDQIITAAGQFLRLHLSSDAQIDLDERSRLIVEKSKPEPTFRLDSGRMGVTTAQQDVLLHLPQGTVRVSANSVVDVWLPTQIKVEWPAWMMKEPDSITVNEKISSSPAIATVISGTIYIQSSGSSEGVAKTHGNRVILNAQSTPKSIAVDLAGSRVVETRRGNSWHAADGGGPQDRAVIGLFERPDFKELGQRMGMTRNTQPAIADALAQLHEGMQSTDPAARAEKLAAGQQALRAAYEPLAADDERRDFGRMLEGLAHLERGRSLIAKDTVAAHAAFDAARVAFEEALRPDTNPNAEPKPDWARQIAAGPSVTLRELSPASQSALLASFNHAVAQMWLSIDESETKDRAVEAAKEFESLRTDLNKSVEGMSARLAQGLALQFGGKNEKAIEAYAEVLATPMAGWSDATRRYGDGLKQASLLAMAKLYMQMRQLDKAAAVHKDFLLLYPLGDSAVEQAIRNELGKSVRDAGNRELQARNYEGAIDRYREWQQVNPSASKDAVDVYLKVLAAAIAGKFPAHATEAVEKLNSDDFKKLLTETQQAALKKLSEQAKAMPADEANPRFDGVKNIRN